MEVHHCHPRIEDYSVTMFLQLTNQDEVYRDVWGMEAVARSHDVGSIVGIHNLEPHLTPAQYL